MIPKGKYADILWSNLFNISQFTLEQAACIVCAVNDGVD